MLRMDQAHVIRHKVLIEGQSSRRVAREMQGQRYFFAGCGLNPSHGIPLVT